MEESAKTQRIILTKTEDGKWIFEYEGIPDDSRAYFEIAGVLSLAKAQVLKCIKP